MREVVYRFKGCWKMFARPTESMIPCDIVLIVMAIFADDNINDKSVLSPFIDMSLETVMQYEMFFRNCFNDRDMSVYVHDTAVDTFTEVFLRTSLNDTYICTCSKNKGFWVIVDIKKENN